MSLREAIGVMLAITAIGCVNSSTGPSPISDSLDSPSGRFRLRNAGVAPTETYARLADSRWDELQECLGLHYSPRLFKIDLRATWWVSGDGAVGGVYHLRTGIEVIADDVQSWKHEMMHYLLDVAENNPDRNHTRGGLVVYSHDYAGNPVSQGADWLRCTVK